MRVLLIDNYDSFTFNVKEFIESCFNLSVDVIRNDDVCLKKKDLSHYSLLVLSPGPKDPKSSGYCLELVAEFVSLGKSIFGICLGMQIINEFFGGETKQSSCPQHGYSSYIQYINQHVDYTKEKKADKKISDFKNRVSSPFSNKTNNKVYNEIYNQITNPFQAMRYNSLYCVVKSLNLVVDSFLVGYNEPMSIRHKTKKILAFQYHPESFLSFNSVATKNQFIKNINNFFLK